MSRQQELVQHLQQQRLARLLALPTDDGLVKARLRELSVPVCLFGENAHDRRERLRATLAQRGITQGMPQSYLEAQRKAKEEEERMVRSFPLCWGRCAALRCPPPDAQ